MTTTTATESLKLTRNGECYDTACGTYRVIKSTGKTWSAARGTHNETTWTAISLTQKTEDGLCLRAANATSLADLRVRLAQYIADAAAGCTRNPLAYRVYP